MRRYDLDDHNSGGDAGTVDVYVYVYVEVGVDVDIACP